MKIRSKFHNQDVDSITRMGGYKFAILDNAIEEGIGSWYSVYTYDIATNDIHDLWDVVENEANVLSYTKGANLVAIDGDFKFRDMGLMLHSGDKGFSRRNVNSDILVIKNAGVFYGTIELTGRALAGQTATKIPEEQYPSESAVDLFTQGSDAQGAKMSKRASTIGRPTRVSVSAKSVGLKKFRVLVLPESPALDGIGLVNGKLLDAGIISIDLPGWVPELRADVIKRLDKYPAWNTRVVGDLEFVDIKGNVLLDMEGHLKMQAIRDDILPDDVAFVTSADNVKKEMHPKVGGCGWTVAIFEPQGVKDAFNDQQTVTNNPFLISIPDVRRIVKDEGKKAYELLVSGQMMSSIQELAKEEYDTKFSMTGESYNRLLRWRTSAWMLYGMSYMDSKWLFEQLGRQWTQTLNWDSKYWTKTLKVLIPCAVRAQVISASAANLVTGFNMQPVRGTPEWSEKLQMLVMNDQDWIEIVIPSHGGCDLDDFFVIRWVTIQDEKKILITRNPNVRGEYTVWDYKPGDFFPTHTNSKGEEISFPEITKKAWPKQILKAIADGDTRYLKLPTEISTEATLDDDRQALLEHQQKTLNDIIASGKGVDAVLADRLNVPDITPNYDGMITKAKSTMAEEITTYVKRVYDYSAELEPPKYLQELGDNEMLLPAKKLLGDTRKAMWVADGKAYDTDAERSAAVRKAQEDILIPAFSTGDPVVDARYIMAYWLACWKTPTSKGRITDQSIFGTEVFNLLVNGLLYLGIAQKPGFSTVKYEGDHTWLLKCKVCGATKSGASIHQLVGFHNNNRTCKNCR